MNWETYQIEAARTEAAKMHPVFQRLASPAVNDSQGSAPNVAQEHRKYPIVRLTHAALGLCTEAGEFNDALKRHIFYGAPLDRTNLIEEVGDILWYLNISLNVVGSSFDEATDANIAKLSKRFPEKFTELLATQRNLAVERAALEAGKAVEALNGAAPVVEALANVKPPSAPLEVDPESRQYWKEKRSPDIVDEYGNIIKFGEPLPVPNIASGGLDAI